MSEALLSQYDLVIGLEVHCQLDTKSKLFCGCSTAFGGEPNAHTCPVCLGLPGALPVVNKTAVDYAIMLALAVGADINRHSVFARKQYFYPDLPKGYQISQFDQPLCERGGVRLDDQKFVPLIRIHIEEDAGKNVHAERGSFVDLNRAGIPLLEIVSAPALTSAEDAAAYLKKLHAVVRYLNISNANMEEGSFRCDANVSLKPRGAKELGTRCEIKNLNSFRNIERAIHYEAVRQADILAQGGKIQQQTMLFDAASGTTRPMRSKEESHDYRYFPDPDLPPLVISEPRILRARETMPELPDAVESRFIATFELPAADAAQITGDRDLALYFEAGVAELRKGTPKLLANWLLSELAREVNDRGWSYASCPVPPAALAALVDAIAADVISGKIAKTVFRDMVETGRNPAEIIKDKGLIQISDSGAIRDLVGRIVDANPAQVEQFHAGKDKILGFFVGRIMKESGGKMNPALVNEILLEVLNAKKPG
jgi:aspartyl-tRNA(Asn)/glutamyl-tRNA(Gln) amidotransferase subunit B